MVKKIKNSNLYIRLRYLYNQIRTFLKWNNNKFIDEECLEDVPHIYIFLAADYGNLGDIAITYAQRKFLEDNFKEYKIKEIPLKETYKYIFFLKNKIKTSDIITIVGGGNMTDLYEYFEERRRTIISTFRNNKIISFPQTISFSNTNLGKQSFKRTKKIYNKHKNLYIFARENNSYNFMKKHFKKVFLCPDIVFYLNGIFENNSDDRIGICFRDDKEKTLSIKMQQVILHQLNDFKIENLDTHIGDNNLIYDKRYEILKDFLKNISTYKFVVTDRLHGMIFSYITSTPCLALDNSNHKIQSTYETWLKGEKLISLISENDMYLGEKIKSLEKEGKLNLVTSLDFKILKDCILENV